MCQPQGCGRLASRLTVASELCNRVYPMGIVESNELDVSDQSTDGPAAGSAQFGQLARISARLGWPHEAHKFTPWLAENVGLLGEAVGLSLGLREREHKVGAVFAGSVAQ